jgi:hypothetical protein
MCAYKFPCGLDNPPAIVVAFPSERTCGYLGRVANRVATLCTCAVRHSRYVVFQLAEVAVPRALFADILRRIDGLRLRSPPLPA